jgi:hypothetical protein
MSECKACDDSCVGMCLEHSMIAQGLTEERCQHTGNLCGTDTWAVGWTCPCATCQRSPCALNKGKLMKNIRVERSWHAGHTLLVFQTLGPSQIAISVLGSIRTSAPPCDSATGREVKYSIGLTEADIAALEDFLKQRRQVAP